MTFGTLNEWPAAGTGSLLDGVKSDLHSDLTIGNLERARHAADDQCSPGEQDCYQFEAPDYTARDLKQDGFAAVNVANNHTLDAGPAGEASTDAALRSAHLAWTGRPGQITYLTKNGIKIALLGFAPWSYDANMLAIPAAEALVRQAKEHAQVVIVIEHAGAEGDTAQHVRPGEEYFLGQDRGDSIAFTHGVIDAGADLVMGSGPHVLRGFQWYHGHLIAYSLGNSAATTLGINGVTSVSAILHVTLNAKGQFVRGSITPLRLESPGTPEPDPSRAAIGLINRLSRDDFAGNVAPISPPPEDRAARRLANTQPGVGHGQLSSACDFSPGDAALPESPRRIVWVPPAQAIRLRTARAAGSVAACRCVLGSVATNSTARGYLYGAISALTKSCSSRAVTRRRRAVATTTYALTSCPRASSGTPTTAHSATAGCLSSASSTSGPGDVVAGADDHVVAARLVPEVAVVVADEGVAGEVPAVVHVASLARVVQVAAAGRALHGQPAGSPSGTALPSVQRSSRRSPAPRARWSPAGCRQRPTAMKMCSISVLPMPSMISTPVASRNASQVAFGRCSPAETAFRRARSWSVLPAASIALYAVGAVKQIVTPCCVDRVGELGRRRLLHQQGRRAGVQREEQQPPSPNVNASGGVPVNTSSGTAAARARRRCRQIASTSRWKCIVAFGLPVVPEVKASIATSSAGGLHVGERRPAWRRQAR